MPFASFVYFCVEDNAHINRFANNPGDVHRAFLTAGLPLAVLFPGKALGPQPDGEPGATLARYAAEHEHFDRLPLDSGPLKDLDEIRAAFASRFEQLASHYPKIVLRLLRPLVVRIPDLEINVRFALSNGSFEVVADSEPEDLVISSQPLWLCFAQPFGVQTLGVSGRLIVHKSFNVWKRYRILTSLNNAEISLEPRYLLPRQNLSWVRSRLRGGLSQLRYQLQRMR